jgi:hypothetical protein
LVARTSFKSMSIGSGSRNESSRNDRSYSLQGRVYRGISNGGLAFCPVQQRSFHLS